MGSPAAPGGVESDGQDWGCLDGIWEGRACKLSQKELSFQMVEAEGKQPCLITPRSFFVPLRCFSESKPPVRELFWC